MFPIKQRLLILLLSVFWIIPVAAGEFPAKAVKVVIPFGAGGGSDTFSRILQKVINDEELLEHPLVIVNVPGAGGSIGSRRVVQARPDGHTILCLHDGVFTAHHSGKTPFGWKSLSPIIGTGVASEILAVPEDSRFQDLGQLIQEIKDAPDTVIAAANLGAPSHFALLQLGSKVEGGAFRFVQSGGGAKRFAALQGGHADCSTFSVAEYQQFRASGLKALCVFTKDRHPAIPDVPTASELDIPFVSSLMQYWWAPKGTPQDRIDVLVAALEKAMQHEFAQQRLAESHIQPVILKGDALIAHLTEQDTSIAKVSTRTKSSLPNFAMGILIIVIGLGILAFFKRSKDSNRSTVTPEAKVILQTLGYAGLVSVIPFWLATTLFLNALSWSMGGFTGSKVQNGIKAISFLIGAVFLQWLFTRVLFVDLP